MLYSLVSVVFWLLTPNSGNSLEIPSQATQEVRLSQAKAALDFALESAKTVPNEWKYGRSHESLRDGAMVDRSFCRAAALLRIAHAQGLASDVPAALKTLEEFRQLSKGEESTAYEAKGVYSAVLRHMARSGDLQTAVRMAGKDADLTNPIYLDAVESALQTNDFATAILNAGKMSSGWQKVAAQSRIAVQLGKSGDYMAAQKEAARIEDPGQKLLALLDLAARARMAGNGAVATTLLAECKGLASKTKGYDRSMGQMLIAVELARSGDYAGASKLADQLKDIEAGGAKVGNTTIASSGEYGLAQRLRCQIALEQAKSGHFKEALRGAQEANDVPSKEIRQGRFITWTKGLYGVRPKLLCQISIAQSLAGDSGGAESTLAKAIPLLKEGSPELVQAYTELGAAYMRSNQKDQAIAAFNLGLQKAIDIADRYRPDSFWIVVAMFKSGLVEQAKTGFAEAMQAIASREDFTIYAYGVLAGFAKDIQDQETVTKLLQRAFEVVKENPVSPGAVGDTGGGDLQAAAKVLAERSQFDLALRLAERSAKPEIRTSIFEEIAFEQGKAGDAKAAHLWLDKLEQPMERTFALIGYAEGLLEVFMPDRSSEVPLWIFEWMPN